MIASRRLILTRALSGPTGAEPHADLPLTQPLSPQWHRVHWPLIAIEPVTDAATVQGLQQAWQDWPQWQAVMWVSAAAAQHFFSHRPQGQAWSSVQAWCTGPGTAKALLNLGVPAACLVHPKLGDPNWDSEALWQLVQPTLRPGVPVLRVRGREHRATEVQGQGRDWLSDQLQAMNVPVHSVAAYERRAPTWSGAQREQALQALTDGSVWWFTSSQAVEHLRGLLPHAKATQLTQARAVVTHARIAQACLDWGWGHVVSSPPDEASVLKSIESFA